MIRKIRGGPALDSILLTFTRILTAGISILVYKLLAVNYSLEEYGLYSQAMLIVSTVTSLTIFGMTDAVNYFYNKEKNNYNGKTYIHTIFTIQFIIGSTCAALLIALRFRIAVFFGNDDLISLVILIALFPLLANLLNMIQVLFFSIKKAKIIAIRNLVLSLVKVISIMIISIFAKDIKYVLLITLVIDLLSLLYLLSYFSINAFSIDPKKADFRLVKEILLYCIPMAGYIITNSLVRNIDKLVIGWFAGTSDLALYSIASRELPFDILTSAFLTVLIPYITRQIVMNDFQNAGRTFSKYIQISYLVTWIIGIGAIILSNDLMLILYDIKYLSALPIFQIYMIVDMIKFANTSLVFSATNKTKELLVYSGIALLFNLVFSIIFYKVFGLAGPAIVTVVITLGLSILMLLRSTFLLKTNFFEVICIRQVLLILTETILFGFIAKLISVLILGNMSLLPRFIIAYLFYLIALLLLNYSRIIRLLKTINQEKLS